MQPVTIGALLDATAGRHPTADALVFPELSLHQSYREFLETVNRLAKGLMGLGIEAGENLAVWGTNWPQWVWLQFAAAKVGAVLVTINPAYRVHELAYVLEQSESRSLFMVSGFRSSDYLAMISELCPELGSCRPGRLVAKRLPGLKRVAVFEESAPRGVFAWGDVLSSSAGISDHLLRRRQDSLDPDDAINIQYTSGTTGFPKGAQLTHNNLVRNASYCGQCMRLTRKDRLCIPVPFYHCFGCVLGTMAAVCYGCAMVIPAEHFDPEKTLAAAAAERCTVIHGVPTMFVSELSIPSFNEFDLRSLRTGIMAGAPCPEELMREVVERMHAREMTIAYGQTEASPVITQTRTEDPVSLRVSTVGRALPSVEVKIVNPDTGRKLRPGAQGELCCRSGMVMKGYYNMAEATEEAIDREGWLHTGDLATMDEHGYCRITGRMKDMIIRGGENVYPREVEDFLYSHPMIAEAHVFGLPDPKLGEEVATWIRLKQGAALTPEEVRSFCRNQIAHYKVPRYIKFVAEFPMTVTGKVQKFKMREQASRELGLAPE